MKNTILCAACVAIPLITGCTHTNDATQLKSETGRGTFASSKGEAVTAVYYKAGGTRDRARVRLLFPDKTQTELYVAMSGSGARYTNLTAEWWEHQGEATYNVGGTNIFRGQIMSAK